MGSFIETAMTLAWEDPDHKYYYIVADEVERERINKFMENRYGCVLSNLKLLDKKDVFLGDD